MTEPSPPKPPQGDASAVPRLTVPGVAGAGFTQAAAPAAPPPLAAPTAGGGVPPLTAPPPADTAPAAQASTAQPQTAPTQGAPDTAQPAPKGSAELPPLGSLKPAIDPASLGGASAESKPRPKARMRSILRPRLLGARELEPSNKGAESRIAGALTLVWLLSVAAYATLFPGLIAFVSGSLLNLSIAIVAVFFPLVLIWTVAFVSTAIRSIRLETLEMRQSLASLRATVQQNGALDLDRELQERLNRILVISQSTDDKLRKLADQTAAVASATHATAQRQAEAAKRAEEQVAAVAAAAAATPAPAVSQAVATPQAALGSYPKEEQPPRDAAAFAPPKAEDQDEDQARLPLHTPEGPDRIPISVAEFIRAMNFPENADDKEGFRVLRRAFEERDLGKLLRASQDVLTLLSQDGIYVDDLNPDRPLPQVWRKFAEGQRGLSVVALGGIRDRSALTLTKARLKNDPVFRDATHHFLRQFDKVLGTFTQTAKDGELIEMSSTRTARAFMLLGRVAGAFD